MQHISGLIEPYIALVSEFLPLQEATEACRWSVISIYCRGKEYLEITSILPYALMTCTRTDVLHILALLRPDIGAFV
jgi:hypothetical protein